MSEEDLWRQQHPESAAEFHSFEQLDSDQREGEPLTHQQPIDEQAQLQALLNRGREQHGEEQVRSDQPQSERPDDEQSNTEQSDAEQPISEQQHEFTLLSRINEVQEHRPWESQQRCLEALVYAHDDPDLALSWLIETEDDPSYSLHPDSWPNSYEEHTKDYQGWRIQNFVLNDEMVDRWARNEPHAPTVSSVLIRMGHRAWVKRKVCEALNVIFRLKTTEELEAFADLLSHKTRQQQLGGVVTEVREVAQELLKGVDLTQDDQFTLELVNEMRPVPAFVAEASEETCG